MNETRITLTESQLRSLVESIWLEAYSDGCRDGADGARPHDQRAAKAAFAESCVKETVNKLIELEKSDG
jgi:hypothetical protein